MSKSKENSGEVSTEIFPQAFIETITAGALVSLGKFAYDASKDAYVALKPDKPLQVSIEDSITTESGHVIIAVIQNLGLHSVYLESFGVDDPKGTHVQANVLEKRSAVIDMDKLGARKEDQDQKKNRSEKFKPYRLLSNNVVRIKFDIDLLPKDRLTKEPFTTLVCHYNVLGIASKPKPLKIGIAIRPAE